MTRRPTTAACVCAIALGALLAACSQESDESASTASDTAIGEHADATTSEAPASTSSASNTPMTDGTARKDDDAAILAKATDPELCGDEDAKNGAFDLPMPSASVVTVTGYDPDPTTDTPSTLSNDGTFLAVLDGTPEIVVGKPFGFSVTFTRTDGEPMRINYTDLSPDAHMPQHFHGMNVTPSAEGTGAGTFDVSGMVFHMTGLWEVYLDLTVEDVTERSQFIFDVK